MEEHWTRSQDTGTVAPDPFIQYVFIKVYHVPAQCQVLGSRNMEDEFCLHSTHEVAERTLWPSSRYPFWASISLSAKEGAGSITSDQW